MRPLVRLQLSLMMFLQYFIWGAWTVTMGTYLMKGLKFPASFVGTAYGASAIAAIVSPFFVGMIADRFFSTQKILGVLHLAGAALLFAVSTMHTTSAFFGALLAYVLCYMPTLALTNSISFRQMKDPGKEFPSIRVLGTLGWIAAGLSLTYIVSPLFRVESVEATAIPFRLSAILSVVLGVLCFSLPKTPPSGAGQKVTIRDILGLDALGLLKDPSFLVFVVASLLICIPLAFYYNFTNVFLNEVGVKDAVSKMTLGQASEVFFMLVMPFFFARLGVKWMLIVGMGAWATRYALFGFGNAEALMGLLYVGILLHGVCYDFFFVTGQIYVDKRAPEKIRASAQGLIAVATLGIGMWLGSLASGWIVDMYPRDLGAQYTLKDDAKSTIAFGANGKFEMVNGDAKVTGDYIQKDGSVTIKTPTGEQVFKMESAKPKAQMKAQITATDGKVYDQTGTAYNWRKIWMIPAAMAAAIMVLFALFFHEKKSVQVEAAVEPGKKVGAAV